MEFLRVTGGNRLDGRLKIASAKNAVLPIIACALLAESEIKIKNCPRLSDITAMMKIIRSTGGRADFEGDDIVLDCSSANPSLIESVLTGGSRSAATRPLKGGYLRTASFSSGKYLPRENKNL